MFFKKNISSETQNLQNELLISGYDFKQLLGGCYKPRDNYLDIAEILAKHLDKKYHWYNLQKITSAIGSMLLINCKLIETDAQTDRRHRIIRILINHFNSPNVGHNKFEVTEQFQSLLDKFNGNIEELLKHKSSWSINRSINCYLETDDIFLSTILDLWQTSKNALTSKELFWCLISFNRIEELYHSRLNNKIENKRFVESFLEHDDGFLSIGHIHYCELNNRKELIGLIEQLDCSANDKFQLLANKKIDTIKKTDFELIELSNLLVELPKNIFINPRLKNINPDYVEKKQWKFVAETLISHMDKESYWAVKSKIYRLLGENWYASNNKLRHTVLDKLFEHLGKKNISEFKVLSYPELVEVPKDLDSRINEVIAVSISEIIKPSNKKDKEFYFEKLKSIVEKEEYGHSRYYLLKPFARLGKNEVTDILIKLINGTDNSLNQSALEEIRRLKPKEAKPHLEKFIAKFGREYDFHKEIAQTALRGINKKHF